MLEKFRQRSYQLEHLDKGDYTPEEYEGCIVELQWVNEWLGDASALRDSLLKEIANAELKSFSVLDVGAGSGELLRVTAKGARKTDRKAIAYFLYTTVGHLFLHNRLIREDGALSILRSFKPDELEEIGRKAGLDSVKVEKHFPSRLVLSSTGT